MINKYYNCLGAYSYCGSTNGKGWTTSETLWTKLVTQQLKITLAPVPVIMSTSKISASAHSVGSRRCFVGFFFFPRLAYHGITQFYFGERIGVLEIF